MNTNNSLAQDIETLGHILPVDPLMNQLRTGRDAWNAVQARKPDDAHKTPYSESSSTQTMDCFHCGRSISFGWSGVETEAPVIVNQFELGSGTYEAYVPRLVLVDSCCPMPVPGPVVLKFKCRSGRIAPANDLRSCVLDARKTDLIFGINSFAGKESYIKWYAKHNYLTGYVGNSPVWFCAAENGLDVMISTDAINSAEDDSVFEAEHNRMDKTAIHRIHTELFWFTVVDAEDVREGGTDSYDREIGYMDLPVGEYEYIVQPYNRRQTVIATLRRTGDLSPAKSLTLKEWTKEKFPGGKLPEIPHGPKRVVRDDSEDEGESHE